MVVVGVPLGSLPLSGAWICEGSVEMGKKHMFLCIVIDLCLFLRV